MSRSSKVAQQMSPCDIARNFASALRKTTLAGSFSGKQRGLKFSAWRPKRSAKVRKKKDLPKRVSPKSNENQMEIK